MLNEHFMDNTPRTKYPRRMLQSINQQYMHGIRDTVCLDMDTPNEPSLYGRTHISIRILS